MKKIGLLFSALLIVALAAAWLVPSWAAADVEAEACTKATHPEICHVYGGGTQHPNAITGPQRAGCSAGSRLLDYPYCEDCCDAFFNDPDCDAIVGVAACYCTIAQGDPC